MWASASSITSLAKAVRVAGFNQFERISPPVPFQGLAKDHSWMGYLQGTATAAQRNDLAAEQALALDLGATVEKPTRPAGITIDRLTMLFRPVLRKFAIDETDPGEKQLEEFLGSTEPYVATTRGREY